MNKIKINSIVKTKKTGPGYIHKSYIKDIKTDSEGQFIYLIASSPIWWKEDDILLIRE